VYERNSEDETEVCADGCEDGCTEGHHNEDEVGGSDQLEEAEKLGRVGEIARFGCELLRLQ